MTRYQAICDCGHTALWDTDEQAHADLRSHPCPDRPALTTAPDRTELAALVEQYLPLARGTAHRMAARHRVDTDEAYADALVGLWTAATRYDPTLGARFGTYAKHRIAGAILDGIRERGPVTRHDIRTGAAPRFIPLDQPLTADPDGAPATIADLIPDTDGWTSADSDLRLDLIAEFRRRFRRLPDRDQRIVLDRLTTGRDLADIGDTFGLTESRISQILIGVGAAALRRE